MKKEDSNKQYRIAMMMIYKMKRKILKMRMKIKLVDKIKKK